MVDHDRDPSFLARHADQRRQSHCQRAEREKLLAKIPGIPMGWNGKQTPRQSHTATVHIPTVSTRHPLWDDHDEEADPENERLAR